jgi:hypothetical protein
MVFLAASANLQVHSHKVPHVLVFLCPFFCMENEVSLLSYVSRSGVACPASRLKPSLRTQFGVGMTVLLQEGISLPEYGGDLAALKGARHCPYGEGE